MKGRERLVPTQKYLLHGLFGVARVFILAVVAFAIFNWLVADKQQPQWVKDAKTRPILTATAVSEQVMHTSSWHSGT